MSLRSEHDKFPASLPIDCEFYDEVEADDVRTLACVQSKRDSRMLLPDWPGSDDVLSAMIYAAERLRVCRDTTRSYCPKRVAKMGRKKLNGPLDTVFIATKRAEPEPTAVRIRSLTDLSEEVQCGIQEVVMALGSGRPMLLKLWKCPPEGLPADEAGRIMNVLRVVMETNLELQRRCRTVMGQIAQLKGAAADMELLFTEARDKSFAFLQKVKGMKFPFDGEVEG